jgi:hypothetical protein
VTQNRSVHPPETDIEKLQLSLAGTALALLACEEKCGATPEGSSLQPFEVAKLLGYEGDIKNRAVRQWLVDFFNGPTTKRVERVNNKRE